MTDAAYESDVFERSQEIMDLFDCSYEDALQAARRELEARR